MYSIDLNFNDIEKIDNTRFKYNHGTFSRVSQYYGIHKPLNEISYYDVRSCLKGLFDYLGRRQRVKHKTYVTRSKIRSKGQKYVILGVISKSHKKHLRGKLKPSFYHAHLLVLSDNCTAIVNLIKRYWIYEKHYAYSVYYEKCCDAGKLFYNLDQMEGNLITAISPCINYNDLLDFGIDAVFIANFNSTHKLTISAITQLFYGFGIAIKNQHTFLHDVEIFCNLPQKHSRRFSKYQRYHKPHN